jgi:hypothetical protein
LQRTSLHLSSFDVLEKQELREESFAELFRGLDHSNLVVREDVNSLLVEISSLPTLIMYGKHLHRHQLTNLFISAPDLKDTRGRPSSVPHIP